MKTIASTNYPRNYPNYDAQNWTLAVEGNSRMVLKFTVFDIETNKDFLKVIDKTNILKSMYYIQSVGKSL